MGNSFARRAVLALLGCGCLALPGCDTTSHDAQPDTGARVPPPPKAWTARFQAPAVLVADSVRIEGPDGLLDHVATRADDAAHVRTERVTADGFLTTIERRTGVAPLEIKAFLDRFEIAAWKRLVLLERPGPVDVVLIAEGEVFLHDTTSGKETRGATLRIDGKIPR